MEIGPGDIVCNLPFADGCAMWFDHHSSEDTPKRHPARFVGRYGAAPSAARLVYEYFVGDHPEITKHEPLLQVVDRFDSANLTWTDITDPEPAMLLCFVLDPRTGLGYHHEYRISNRDMTQMMPDLLLKLPLEEILAMPDIRERVNRYKELQGEATGVYAANTSVDHNVLVTDFRGVEPIPPANRFLVYTLPGAEATNVSIRISTTKGREKVSFQVGHNIFNRTCRVDVGALMASYGGGGHRGAGTCQVAPADADRVLGELLAALREG